MKFLGFRTTEDPQDGVWLATQLLDFIILFEEGKKFHIYGLSSDNAAVCARAVRILNKQEAGFEHLGADHHI